MFSSSYFSELSSLLKESESLRVHQEASGELGQPSRVDTSIRPGISARESQNEFPYLSIIFGPWNSKDFANLVDEFKWSRNPWKLIIIASLISLAHTWCVIGKGFVAGKVTDALTTVFTTTATSSSSSNIFHSPPPPSPPPITSYFSTMSFTLSNESEKMNTVYNALILLTIVSLVEWLLLTIKDVLFDIAYSERALLSRTRYFSSMIKQDARFHATHRSAELNQRLWVDANEIDEIVVFTLERALIGFTSLITIAAMMHADSGLTTLCIALRIPFALQMIERSVQLGAAFSRILTVSLEKAKSRSAELLSNIKVIQSSAAEENEVEGFAALVMKHVRIVRGASFAHNSLRRAEDIVKILINLILLAYGAWRIQKGDLTLGRFQALRGTADGFTTNFHSLEAIYNSIRGAALKSRRYYALRDRQPEIPLTMPDAEAVTAQLRTNPTSMEGQSNHQRRSLFGNEEVDKTRRNIKTNSNKTISGNGGGDNGDDDVGKSIISSKTQFKVHGEGVIGGAVSTAIHRLRRASTKMDSLPTKPLFSSSSSKMDSLPTKPLFSSSSSKMDSLPTKPLSSFSSPSSSSSDLLNSINDDALIDDTQDFNVGKVSHSETISEESNTVAQLLNTSLDISFSNVSFKYSAGECQYNDRDSSHQQNTHISSSSSSSSSSDSIPCSDASDEFVLRDVSFVFMTGKTTAIVGPSGSGKSTIARLLLRLYDPTHGSISIGGRNFKSLDVRDLRRNIGFVDQECALLDRSISENIALGVYPPPSRLEIEQAAKRAHAFDFISSIPEGFDANVGEKGSRLSGGQRQRIAISRAVLRSPRLLVLDEATASLDAESESAVQRSLNALMAIGKQKGGGGASASMTTILITHKLQGLESLSDFILVLDRGRVAEYGSFKELSKNKDGLFSRMLRTQVRGGGGGGGGKTS